MVRWGSFPIGVWSVMKSRLLWLQAGKKVTIQGVTGVVRVGLMGFHPIPGAAALQSQR